MRCLVASVLPVAAAIAQDRCASEAAAAGESLGIDIAPASYRSEAVRPDQGLLPPWLAVPFCFADHGDPSGTSTTRVVGGSYMGLHRPRNSFGTVEETFSFGFDATDTGAGSFDCGLQSSFVLAVELDGRDRQAGNVAVHAAAHLGMYAQLGIEPSISLARLGSGDVTFAVPLTMGFCLKNYYVDVDGKGDLFGFLDLGAVASSPLPFLPSRLGLWHVDVGLHWLLFGDSNEQREPGESTDLIVSFGLSTTF